MERKLGAASALAVLAAVVVFLVAPATGSATPGNGAFQISDVGCNVMDGNGVLYPVFTPTRTVYAPDGSWNLTCRTKGAANPTGSAVTWTFANTGIPCFSLGLGLITLDYSETVSASGNISLTCHFSP
jgi:hypothetical protein